MRGHGRLFAGPKWIILAAILVLVAAHGLVLNYLSTYMALSTTVVTGVVILAVLKHVGVLGSLYGLLRHGSRSDTR